MIDWQRVHDLRSDFGADDFAEVANMFLLEVSEALKSVPASLSDPDECAALLHYLKGAALNLGFAELGEQCRQGESAASRGDTAMVSAARLSACFDASRQEFEARVAQLDAA